MTQVGSATAQTPVFTPAIDEAEVKAAELKKKEKTEADVNVEAVVSDAATNVEAQEAPAEAQEVIAAPLADVNNKA